MKFLILFLFLAGCAGLPLQTQSPAGIAGGALGGVAVTKTIEKVKEVFTPHYLLQVQPVEICDITGDPVKCFIIPCDNESLCMVGYERVEWFANNPKVQTIRTSQVTAILEFCQHNLKACENYQGHYQNKTIVIVKEHND